MIPNGRQVRRGHRPWHEQHTLHPLHPDRGAGGDRQARPGDALPEARLGGDRHAGGVAEDPGVHSRGAHIGGRLGRGGGGGRDCQRARVRRSLGSKDRSTGGALDHLAGYADGGHSRRPGCRWWYPPVPSSDRTAHFDVFVCLEARVAARPGALEAGRPPAAISCSERRTPGSFGTSRAVRMVESTSRTRRTPVGRS